MLTRQLKSLNLEVMESTENVLATLLARPSIIGKIKTSQDLNLEFQKTKKDANAGLVPNFQIGVEGALYMRGRLYVPNNWEIKKEIMQEAHQLKLSIHPGGTKMNRDLKMNFWWNGMKRDIANFVAKCLTCQRVKAEHQWPRGYLQPLEILGWKWEHITMDFVVRIPRVRQGYNTIWVIVDRLTKFAHFINFNILPRYASKDIHKRDSQAPWNSCNHSVRSGPEVRLTILENLPECNRNQSGT
ncbi:UNVERIFIED_CONTAM: hypothetical protein Slati_4261200 [Sesamum latifolium]|uniref:Integrase zinc-binding domain-containing protein n=1 Tax=Sesamum latifolium TaxID=2727402 RepID=A0AAW2TBY2_9LAMI